MWRRARRKCVEQMRLTTAEQYAVINNGVSQAERVEGLREQVEYLSKELAAIRRATTPLETLRRKARKEKMKLTDEADVVPSLLGEEVTSLLPEEGTASSLTGEEWKAATRSGGGDGTGAASGGSTATWSTGRGSREG